MQTIRIKITDLDTFAGHAPLGGARDVESVTGRVLEQLAFLPQPLAITIEGDEVVIGYSESSDAARAEADRLAQKAAKKGREGDYTRAIELLKRTLQLQPDLHSARRDLAMSFVELGDVENATNHLIDCLRLNPGDAWSWVVLGNLYVQKKGDPVTGEKFFRKALELQPGDAWALNGLATVHLNRRETAQAADLFEQAIAANPDFPNACLGLATAQRNAGDLDAAQSALERLFAGGRAQDTRSQPIFGKARELFADLQSTLAEKNESAAFKTVQDYKAELEQLSGCPIRIEETEFKDTSGARMQMAWKHGRDHHHLLTRSGFPPTLLPHLQAHEMTHLWLEARAREAGTNKFFLTNARTTATAMHAIAPDLRKLRAAGHTAEAVTKLSQNLIHSLSDFLFNCPLDMIIERHLHETFPALRPAQFLSLRVMAGEAWALNSRKDIRAITPRKIHQAGLALNGAWCLFLDDLYQGATDYTAPYRALDTFSRSQELHRLWLTFSNMSRGGGDITADAKVMRTLLSADPGLEFRLIDEFAAILGLSGWYEWRPDPGTHDISDAAPATTEGASNPALLQAKQAAAIPYFLDALRRFEHLSVEQVRALALEIAMLGQGGLDYAKADAAHTLKAIPGERFTGLQLMCLMFAAFRRIAPDQDLGMDLNDAFLAALEIHQGQEGGQR